MQSKVHVEQTSLSMFRVCRLCIRLFRIVASVGVFSESLDCHTLVFI